MFLETVKFLGTETFLETGVSLTRCTAGFRRTISVCTRKFRLPVAGARDYQRIKMRACRLSGLVVRYPCGHLSFANVLPGFTVVASALLELSQSFGGSLHALFGDRRRRLHRLEHGGRTRSARA